MISTNVNTDISSIGKVPIENGYITLSESVTDYPKLTIVFYSNENPSAKTGDTINLFGMSFVLESISVDICPIDNYEKQITYGYVHVSKCVMEYPLNVYDFVQTNKGSSTKQTGDSYFFPLGTLAAWASSKSVLGSVSAPPYLVELSRTPGAEETTTIKEHMDEYMQREGHVYKYSGHTVSSVSLGTGGTIPARVVSNYTIATNAVPTYKKTILSWNKKDDIDNNPLDKKKYKQLDSKDYMLYEGDFKPHMPPGEDGTTSITPRDLSIMLDNSGVTKSFKITRYKWGKPYAKLEGTFGYANCALELVGDPQKPNETTDAVLNALDSDSIANSGNAFQEVLNNIKNGKYGYPDDIAWAREPVWRLVSIKETDYIYEPLDLQIEPVLKKNDGTLEKVIVPEEYQKFLQSNIEVLVREETKGWELRRFAQEDPGEWTKGSISAWLTLNSLVNLKEELEGDTADSKRLYNWMLYSARVTLEQYFFRKIPLVENIVYAVAPYSQYYKDLDEVDWQVEYIPKNQLKGKENAGETPVPVLFPDPNWSPELMIISSTRYKSAFGVSGNPQYNPFVRNYYGSNPMVITTGSEEYETTQYGALPSKNTKPSITGLLGENDINGILAKVSEGMGYSGTVYNEAHPYMTISDYGVKGINIPGLMPTKVLSGYATEDGLRDDQYLTLVSLRVAQDQSFKSYVTTQSYTLSDGRPPEATKRKPVYEEVKEDKESHYKNSVTYITSDISDGGIDVIPSVNVSSANNLQEALKGASNQLMFSIFTSGSNASVQLDWELFNTSLVNAKINLPKGTWIVKSSTKTVQVSNNNTFAQPIQLDAGKQIVPNIYAQTLQLRNENDEHDSVKVLLKANLPSQLGTPIGSIPADFSRWIT